MSYERLPETSTELDSDWLLLELPEVEGSFISGASEFAWLRLLRLEVLVSKSFLAFLTIEKCISTLQTRKLNGRFLDELNEIFVDDDDGWITGAGSMGDFCWLPTNSACLCITVAWFVLRWPLLNFLRSSDSGVSNIDLISKTWTSVPMTEIEAKPISIVKANIWAASGLNASFLFKQLTPEYWRYVFKATTMQAGKSIPDLLVRVV